MDVLVAVIAALVLGIVLATLVRREDARLRRRVRRYRELELEGIEQMRRNDPYPEEGAVPGAFLREPDGRPTDADRVLREELARVRQQTRATWRGKGAECLL